MASLPRHVRFFLLPLLLSFASPSLPHPSSLPHSPSSSDPWRTPRRRATLNDDVRRSAIQSEYPNLMKSATASYPNSVVGPYDWTYFPAEVPEGALIVRFEFRKLWASQADEAPAGGASRTDAAGESQQAGSSSSAEAGAGAAASGGPLVCFALGSLPLPSDHEPQ
ncbi:unnamed protein product, partial [Closterium sp. NIES-54]